MANTIITLEQLEYILLELKDYIDNNAGTTIGWDYVLNKPVSFPPSSHTHDDRYYTEDEVDTLLSGKSDTGHTHSQYLTEHATVDDALSATSTNAVQNKVVQAALADKSDTGHTHDNRYYTENEVDTLLDGKSDTGHTHSQYLTEHATVDSALSSTSTNAVQNKVINTALAGKAASDHTHSQYLTAHAPVDSALSSTSTNAVQNKVINSALAGKSDTGHTHSQYLTEHQDISGKANTSGTYPSLISGGVRDYNDGSTITFGYSTAGMTSTSWLASWDGYRLRAIAPANVSAGYASTAGTANSAYYADYAEFFPRGEETEVGDIIALDEFSEDEKYVKATENSICVIGVHSEDYGIIVGGENPKDDIVTRDNYFKYNISKYIPVSLAGRVPVKFKGISHKGVRVVPSEIPGVGRAFDATKDDRDSIIGYLVESDNGDNEEIRLLKMKIK